MLKLVLHYKSLQNIEGSCWWFVIFEWFLWFIRQKVNLCFISWRCISDKTREITPEPPGNTNLHHIYCSHNLMMDRGLQHPNNRVVVLKIEHRGHVLLLKTKLGCPLKPTWFITYWMFKMMCEDRDKRHSSER